MEGKYKELLKAVKAVAKDGITQIAFDTWIAPIEIYSIEGNVVSLLVQTPFFADQLRPYEPLLINSFAKVTQKKYVINYVVANNFGFEETLSSANSQIEKMKSNLNPKYTFSTFVIGEQNRFAQAAALAVAEAPGTSYNPLFIYGGVGLGKTHLLHAIGNEILSRSPSKKVLYVTCETFTNEFINCIKDNSNEKFRQKYRDIDVLMIDDIQFLAGKEGIQEEFFHTFNAILQNNGQIILSSDRPPKEIEPLSERLKSRFLVGLLVDIPPADYETRLAILRQKVHLEGIIIDDLILSNIAENIDTNIRELEGTLNKIVAQASLTHSPITAEIAEKALAEVISSKDKVISANSIKETVAKFYNIDVSDLDSSTRSSNVAYPRQLAMYLCRELAKMQYKSIGVAFGNRDHSTVMHACSKIEAEVKNKNKDTRVIVDRVKNLILKPNETN